MANILVIDDEQAILDVIKNGLRKDLHNITVYDSADKVNKDQLNRYDLLLLDVMMPGTDGFDFCKEIRGLISCPILFLTAKTQEQDLALGGDDYITKPFRMAELRARVNAHLRRENRERHTVLSIGKARFDLSAKTLSIDDTKLSLTKGEYEICEFLVRHKGQVFSKDQIYETVFGYDGEGDSSTVVTVHIKNIRAKLEVYDYRPIETVWGIGYKWI